MRLGQFADCLGFTVLTGPTANHFVSGAPQPTLLQTPYTFTTWVGFDMQVFSHSTPVFQAWVAVVFTQLADGGLRTTIYINGQPFATFDDGTGFLPAAAGFTNLHFYVGGDTVSLVLAMPHASCPAQGPIPKCTTSYTIGATTYPQTCDPDETYMGWLDEFRIGVGMSQSAVSTDIVCVVFSICVTGLL